MAGLACGLAAARAGADVRIHEAQAVPGDVPSHHVDVVPNMLRDLVRLGVGDACVRAGFPYRRVTALSQRGTPLLSLDAPRLAGPSHPAALGMVRADLHAVLATAAMQAGACLRYGVHVAGLAQDRSGAMKVLDTGGDGMVADLVVLASGGAGALRAQVFGSEPVAPASNEWLYFLARRPYGLDEAIHAATGTGERVHVVPVNSSIVGVRLSARRPLPAVTPESVRAAMARFPGALGALAEHMDASQPVVRRLIRPALLDAPWTRGRVMAVGDCAHALPPHFGQAAAQALEDAIVLGELLRPGRAPADVAQAWFERRHPRVKQVMSIAMRAAHWDEAPDIDTDFLRLSRELDEVVRTPA